MCKLVKYNQWRIHDGYCECSIRQFTSNFPEQSDVGLKVYGHGGHRSGISKEQSCEISDLVMIFKL